MTIQTILSDLIRKTSVTLNDQQYKQLEQYYNLLTEWNQKMNLTAITAPDEVCEKHFFDSFSALPYLTANSSVADVGCGAGFPGLPLKIAQPNIRLTLLDALNKRVQFLKTVTETLGLQQVTCLHARAEDNAIYGNTLRENFDVCVSRAVSRLNILAEYCLPYVKTGGVFIAYKGPNVTEECNDAKNAIKTLGGEISAVIDYTLPLSGAQHTLVIIKKEKSTPKNYPRSQGKIKKMPL